MNTHIKEAEVNDIKVLNEISVAAKMHWNYPKEWMESWKADLALTEKDFLEQRIFKLETSGTIVGFCALQEHEEVYEVVHLWIRPVFIGKGYGKYLLHESLQRVAIKEKPIIVEADPNAEAFYIHQGFKTYATKESFPEGRFLPLMKKEPIIYSEH